MEQQRPALSEVPVEYQPLIAKLVHERCVHAVYMYRMFIHTLCSDKALVSISKHIQRELLPTQGEYETEPTKDSSPLPLPVVEAAVKHVATRVNYGIDAPNGGKAPQSLCVWRWEVKPEYYDWLPKVSRDKVDARLTERVQVSTCGY